MKKALMMIILFLVSIACVSAHNSQDIQLGAIRFGGTYDNELEMHYNIHNIGVDDINGASLVIWIPDLGYYAQTSAFDIEDGEKLGQFFYPDVSDIEPGTYFTRILVSSDYSSDTKWIWMTIE